MNLKTIILIVRLFDDTNEDNPSGLNLTDDKDVLGHRTPIIIKKGSPFPNYL